ncbi:hypothetical protein F2981_23580 (plasmid) [Sinorhizobium meliloti]|nr:hypothetical protein [Sinorhizobium meliloti]
MKFAPQLFLKCARVEFAGHRYVPQMKARTGQGGKVPPALVREQEQMPARCVASKLPGKAVEGATE